MIKWKAKDEHKLKRPRFFYYHGPEEEERDEMVEIKMMVRQLYLRAESISK